MVQSPANAASRARRSPLDSATLHALALAYVAKFATTRARLAAYLTRKVGERGWNGDGPPAIDSIADRLCEAGYVDDAAFARAKSASMARRGYGARRIRAALHHAGIEPELLAQTADLDAESALAAATAMARRRRFGRFGPAHADPNQARKQLAAMMRAGHGYEAARRALETGDETENENGFQLDT